VTDRKDGPLVEPLISLSADPYIAQFCERPQQPARSRLLNFAAACDERPCRGRVARRHPAKVAAGLRARRKRNAKPTSKSLGMHASFDQGRCNACGSRCRATASF